MKPLFIPAADELRSYTEIVPSQSSNTRTTSNINSKNAGNESYSCANYVLFHRCLSYAKHEKK
jgi:hypothetical protein